MSTRKEAFDLHIDIDSYIYPEDWGATVTVTYPAYGSQPEMKKEYEGDYDSDALEKATKDIQAFLEDPDEWVATYVKESSAIGRQLIYAREQYAESVKDANRYQKYAEQYRVTAEKYAEDIAQLEAQQQVTQESEGE